MPDQILTIATPIFILLLLVEIGFDKFSGGNYYRVNDTFGSLATGVLSQSHRLVFFSLGLWSIAELGQGLSLTSWSMSSPVAWCAAFVLYDFIYYLKHRLMHEVNMFWAGHVVHHQSEEYNLSTALRQPSTTVLLWLLSIPLLLIGISWQMIASCAAWNLIYQFWVHTRYIKKMPSWFEWLMVTPSHHRVHHAQNAIYIDKNHGGVFIVWDRLFGTFQAELNSEPVIFGVRRALASFNPWQANFQVWRSLLQDAWRAQRWIDKARIWFMPTGWRPEDVIQNYPVAKADLSRFQKFDPACSWAVNAYAVLQMMAATLASLLLTNQAQTLAASDVALIWGLISWPLLTLGALLGGANLRWEVIRLGVSWLALTVYWSSLSTNTAVLAAAYLALSSLCLGVMLMLQRSEIRSLESH